MIKQQTVLCTSVGNDGFQAVLKGLREASHFFIMGADCSADAYGLYLADKGVIVPHRSDEEGLLSELGAIIKNEQVDILLPLSTEDQDFYSKNRQHFESFGCKVAVSPEEAVQKANNKHLLYQTLNKIMPEVLPEFAIFDQKNDILDIAEKYRKAGKKFVIKKQSGTGAQGVKIVDCRLNASDKFFNRNNIVVSYNEFMEWIQQSENVPGLLVSELLPGKHVSVDCIRFQGAFAGLCRTEENHYYGMGTKGEIIEEPKLLEQSEQILSELGLEFVNNLEFKQNESGDYKLLEINPRFSAGVDHTIHAGLNLPVLVVRALLDGTFQPPQIKQESLKSMRFWTSITVGKDDKVNSKKKEHDNWL